MSKKLKWNQRTRIKNCDKYRKNKILSTLHKIVVFVLINTLYYVFTNQVAYFIGGILGKLVLILIHFLCAKGVKSGSLPNRLGSIFFTFFMLNAFPIGTLVAVVMLFFSVFKWENADEMKRPNINYES